MQPTETIIKKKRDIEAEPKRVTQRQYLTQRLLTAAINSASGVLTKEERQVLVGLMQGKSYHDISDELQLTYARIHQKEKEATNKILPFLNIADLHLENMRVREENQRLYEEIQRLQAAQVNTAKHTDSPSKQPRTSTLSRNFQGTSFDRMIYDIGLTYRYLKPLSELGIRTIGDLVKLDKMTLVRSPKIGYDACKEIEEKLKALGLHLGMNLNNMSDKVFDTHVKRMSETLKMKSDGRIYEENKAFFSIAATHILEDVIEMAPKLGVPLTPLYMSTLIHVLRRNSYKDVAKDLGCPDYLVKEHAFKAIEQLKMIPEYLNRQMEKIASAAQKENRVYVGELSEKMRLILNTQLKDVPYCNKNSAVVVLEHHGILTVGDLCSRHRSEIEAIRGLRNKMNNVDKILSDLGLTYGMTLYKDSTLVD